MPPQSAWEGHDLVLHRSARTELLFGSESETHKLTDAIISDLAMAANALAAYKPDDAAAAQMAAAGHLTELHNAARQEKARHLRAPH